MVPTAILMRNTILHLAAIVEKKIRVKILNIAITELDCSIADLKRVWARQSWSQHNNMMNRSRRQRGNRMVSRSRRLGYHGRYLLTNFYLEPPLPRYKCQDENCKGKRSYSLHELPALVRAACPENETHGRMKYLGPEPRPWYRGHAISSFLLLVGLFVALCALTGDKTDHSETTVLLTVGLVFLGYELGRISPENGEKRFGLNVSQIRVAGFFCVTILMMAWSQQDIDDGEIKTLVILGALTILWHILVFFGEWYRRKSLLKEFVWDIAKQIGLGILGILFASQIKSGGCPVGC